MDLKYFTREFNLHFCRNYQPRELYRVFNRITPLTKSNFIKIFSDPKNWYFFFTLSNKWIASIIWNLNISKLKNGPNCRIPFKYHIVVNNQKLIPQLRLFLWWRSFFLYFYHMFFIIHFYFHQHFYYVVHLNILSFLFAFYKGYIHCWELLGQQDGCVGILYVLF